MKVKDLALFLECSNNGTPTLETLKQYVDYMAEMKYTQLYLGLTSGFEIESEPYFAYKRGRYTVEQLREIDAYAQSRGIEVIANIQTLAHLGFLRWHECYHDLFDGANSLLVGEEKGYALIEKMIQTVSSALRSKTLHIGMDEAIDLGEGRYKEIHGKDGDKKDLLLTQLERVVKIAEKYGYERCEIWGDMFYTGGSSLTDEEIKNRLPQCVDVDLWKYTESDEKVLDEFVKRGKSFADVVNYAGAAWKISGYAPSNRYSISRMLPQMEVCARNGVQKFIVTVWSDGNNSSSIFSVLPALYAVAEYNGGSFNGVDNLNKEKFKKIVGVEYDAMMSLDYLNDPFYVHYDHFGNRSYWLLLADVFLNSYDVMVSRGTNFAYQKLAKKYAKYFDGKYGYVFKMEAALANVLAVKSELGLHIREGYEKGDLEKLRDCIRQTGLLVNRMKKFIKVFCEYYKREYFSFGIETKTLLLGGLLQRFEYVKGALEGYVKEGIKIDELEEKTLPPSIIPMPNEERCHQVNNKLLLTFNEL